jgi:hypothetical protein
MSIDLMPFLIAWAVVTTAVLALALWRLLAGLHDDSGIHFIEGREEEIQTKTRMAQRMERIELAGKALTVVSAVMIAAIGVVYLYGVWVSGQS